MLRNLRGQKEKMKRKFLLAIILIFTLFLVACNGGTERVERYTVAVGRKAFLSDNDIKSFTDAEILSLPQNVAYSKVLDKDHIIVQDKESLLFGVANGRGDMLIECAFDEITVSGKFLAGRYVDYEKELTDDEILYGTDSNVINEIYYLDGVKLLSVTGSISFQAINDDYCALYYDSYVQVFDKNGVYYFNDRNKVSGRFRFSVCDGLLFGHDSSRGDWFIWELTTQDNDGVKEGQSFILSFYTQDVDSVYISAYLGDGKFVMIESRYSDSDYDYYEVLDGKNYYFKQTCVIFDPTKGTQKTVELEMPIFGFINEYSPDLSVEQRQNLNLNEGYSAVSVPTLGEDKRRISVGYYVVDSSLNFVIKYPKGTSPTAIRFKDGYGFAGEATENYAAALYYMNCDLAWIKDDASYFGQSFNYGRYVSAKVTDDGLRYGVLDSDGETVVDFGYDFISPYTQEYAFAVSDGVYYKLSVDGKSTLLDDCYDDRSLTYYGVYGYLKGEKIGLKNALGDVLINATYDSIDYVGIHDGYLFVGVSSGEEKTLFVIG